MRNGYRERENMIVATARSNKVAVVLGLQEQESKT